MIITVMPGRKRRAAWACLSATGIVAETVLLDAASSGEIGPFVFATDGAGAPNLTLTANEGIDDVDGKVLYMNGPKVLEFTMEAVPDAVERLLAKAQLSLSDIDMFMFHQASKVVLDRIEKNRSGFFGQFVGCVCHEHVPKCLGR